MVTNTKVFSYSLCNITNWMCDFNQWNACNILWLVVVYEPEDFKCYRVFSQNKILSSLATPDHTGMKHFQLANAGNGKFVSMRNFRWALIFVARWGNKLELSSGAISSIALYSARFKAPELRKIVLAFYPLDKYTGLCLSSQENPWHTVAWLCIEDTIHSRYYVPRHTLHYTYNMWCDRINYDLFMSFALRGFCCFD